VGPKRHRDLKTEGKNGWGSDWNPIGGGKHLMDIGGRKKVAIKNYFKERYHTSANTVRGKSWGGRGRRMKIDDNLGVWTEELGTELKGGSH